MVKQEANQEIRLEMKHLEMELKVMRLRLLQFLKLIQQATALQICANYHQIVQLYNAKINLEVKLLI